MLNTYLNCDNIVNIAMFFVIAAAFIFDLKTRKIPNWLNVSAIVLGVFLNLVFMDISRIIYIAFSIGLIFLISLLIYRFRILGGGDLKLFIGLSAFAGADAVIKLMLISLVVGGITYLGYFLAKGNLVERYKNFFMGKTKTKMMYMHNILIGYFLYIVYNNSMWFSI